MINAATNDLERALEDIFAAYKQIPAGSPTWTESQSAIGELLDAVAKALHQLDVQDSRRFESTGAIPARHGEFHYRDGIYFYRLEDGTVRLRFEPNSGGPRFVDGELHILIPPAEWASIIAHVAADGRGPNYQAAVSFHAGK